MGKKAIVSVTYENESVSPGSIVVKFLNFAAATIATIAEEWFLHNRCNHHDR